MSIVSTIAGALTPSADQASDKNKGAQPAVATAEQTSAAKADKQGPAPADTSDIEASGAILEGEIKSAIPLEHPAVENNPRKGLPAQSSQIDFNDPTIPGHEAVARNLAEQGKGSTSKL